jgi:phosphoribosylanthranilate isomerase
MAVKPFGVDSCTGTNAEDSKGTTVRFKKDFVKVKAFVAEIRRAEEDLSVVLADQRREDN